MELKLELPNKLMRIWKNMMNKTVKKLVMLRKLMMMLRKTKDSHKTKEMMAKMYQMKKMVAMIMNKKMLLKAKMMMARMDSIQSQQASMTMIEKKLKMMKKVTATRMRKEMKEVM